MSEQEYRTKIDMTLEHYFDIDREVWSVCMNKRIDYVLRCRKSGVLFGLEVKKKEIHKGTAIGKYLLQASEYSKLVFRSKFGLTKMLIFISPAISSIYKEIKPGTLKLSKGKEYFEIMHPLKSKHSNINSLIGVFGVGEIRNYETYFSFIIKNSEVWNSKYGLKENNYNKMFDLINK